MKIFSKLKVSILFLLFFTLNLKAQNVAINTTGNPAYVSAILDLSNNNTAGTVGFLPPYATLTALGTFGLSGTAAQSNGIIVYCTGLSAVPAGLYYWNNSIPSWVPMGGASVSGSGTLNYLARWTPNGTTLGIGVSQDNGSVAVIQQGAAAFGTTTELTVNANATETDAILGATTIANGAGVTGSNTQTTGTSVGVQGSVGTYNAPVWGASGVYGSANNNTTYGVEGNNPSGDPTGGAGVIGYDYSGTGVIGSNDLITQVGFYHGPHGTGGNFFSAYQGLVGSYNMTGAGGTGIVGFGYNSGGPINPNSGYGNDFGVLGDFGGSAGGAGNGAAVGGFIGATPVPAYYAGVMGASNSTDYGVLGYNTLATGYPLAAINSTGITGKGLFVSGVSYLDGFTGVENAAPTTLFQVGNATTTSGKASIYSQDHLFGQFQIGNPTSNGEASMEFISGVTAFGNPATSTNGTDNLWNIGAASYGTNGNKFNFANGTYGAVMTLTSTGFVGINSLSPQQDLSVNGGENIDMADQNNGLFNNGLVTGNGLSFGNTSGEGIASKRTGGGNQYGLDFYTNFINRMSITTGGFLGIGTTAPNRLLELAGTGNTARIDGLATGGTFNTALGSKSDLMYVNDANGDAYALPAPTIASTLVSSATGVLSWQNGVVPTGSGTVNYLARWTPSGTQLGIGIAQDNGARVSVQTGVSAFPVGNIFTATANATDVTAILGTTAQPTGYGLEGINTATTGTTSAVYGTTTNTTAGSAAIKGSNTSTTGAAAAITGNIGNPVNTVNPVAIYGSVNSSNLGLGVVGAIYGPGPNSVGAYGYNASTGTGLQYGVYGAAIGAATSNVGGYFVSTGATNNYGVLVPSGGGNSGFGTITPTTLVQVGNATTTVGKLSVFSQDNQFGQIQIGNPNANSEASMQFISNVSVFGSAAASASGVNYSWNIGAGTYGGGGQRFIISNLGVGPIMTFVSPTGYVGIGNTSPSQNLSVQNGENIDMGNTNNGFLNNGLATGNGLTFGLASGEGIASRRVGGGNQFGLDFYTNFTNKMSITNGGNVGIGTTAPGQQLEVASTTSTVRIDGIKSGSTYYSATTSASAVSSVMFANNSTGDVQALAPGTTGQILTQTAGGPAWQAASIGALNKV